MTRLRFGRCNLRGEFTRREASAFWIKVAPQSWSLLHQALPYGYRTKLRSSFRSCRDAALCQWRIPQYHAHGAGFCSYRISCQPSTSRGGNPAESGRQRKPLECASARRHFGSVQASDHSDEGVTALLQNIQLSFQLHQRRPIFERGRAQLSAEKARLHGCQEHTNPILQWGRIDHFAERFVCFCGGCQWKCSRPRFAGRVARTVHFTAEPFRRARKKIGASVVGIESLQQSVLMSRLPGRFRFFFGMEIKKHVRMRMSIMNNHENTKPMKLTFDSLRAKLRGTHEPLET